MLVTVRMASKAYIMHHEAWNDKQKNLILTGLDCVYIEKLIRKKEWSTIHTILLDDTSSLKTLIAIKFPLELVRNVVDNVPSFHVCMDHLTGHPKSSFTYQFG